MSKPVYVVSGLPRSGTSMMMKILEAGGLEPMTDKIRQADGDNPKGYYELEAVKRTKSDPSWLGDADGKVVKVIAQLLADLPSDKKYKVVFMRRNLNEILASQKKMLQNRGEENQSTDHDMKNIFASHVEETEMWMRKSEHLDVLFVSYNRMQSDSEAQINRIAKFVGVDLNKEKMAEVVDPTLYRQRDSKN